MNDAGKTDRGLTRGELLRAAAAATPGLFLGTKLPTQAVAGDSARRSLRGMNVVMFITDQDRDIQHFPRGWARRNLPGLTRLQQNGLTFTNSFCNACMCSPARSTLFSGYLPAQHGVKYTLELDMPADQYPQVELPTMVPNLATVMTAAGYNVVYKGKWHLSKPLGETWAPADLAQYGFGRWNPPDAGANQDLSEAGGGTVDHDGRFMEATGDAASGGEGALEYLNSQAAKDAPFFLVISLVNPHDVLFYPRTYKDAGYDDSWLEGDIDLPATVNEDLSTKPDVQARFLRLFNLTGPLPTPRMKRNYLNFYGNLIKSSDEFVVTVLDTLARRNLIDDTLVIRMADHGEMGLTHGGQRQKNFNVYEESLRVPLVFSNPKLFPRAKRSSALVSHVDFLPTMASLFKAPRSARADWEGVDYSRNVLTGSSTSPQSYTVFTWDDWQAGQANGPYVPPPNHIVSIRERRWKIAKYYDADGNVPSQWELYDLKRDPLERRNLAHCSHKRTAEERREYSRLRRKLARVEKTRLKPL